MRFLDRFFRAVARLFCLVVFSLFCILGLFLFCLIQADMVPNTPDPLLRIVGGLIANLFALLGLASGFMAVECAMGRESDSTLEILQSKLKWIVGIYCVAAVVQVVLTLIA